MQHVGCLHQPHPALAYAVWRHAHVSRCCAPRAIQQLKSAPPCRSQPMHTKREMVCTGLPEAMFINLNSITLTVTWMAPNQTALGGMWTYVSAVQLVQTTSRLKWRPSRFFISKCGQKFGLHFVQILKCTRALVTELWPNRLKLAQR